MLKRFGKTKREIAVIRERRGSVGIRGKEKLPRQKDKSEEREDDIAVNFGPTLRGTVNYPWYPRRK